MKRASAAALAAVAALSLSARAHAQDAEVLTDEEVEALLSEGAAAPVPEGTAPEDEEPETIEVRVIGSQADAMQKIPGSGDVIRPEDLRRAQPADVAEVLRRVPGITVRQDPGAGGRVDIGVRGLDPGRSRRVLILEDGIPLSINPYAEPDMYYQPPIERMQGIEVVKGSGSILFGPQTLGGVINFISVPVPYREHAFVALSGGQRGFFKAQGRYGNAHGNARHVTQVLFTRGDGFRDQGFRSLNVLGKVAFETSDRGQATLKVGFHDQFADSDDVGLTAPMYAADPRRPTISPHSRQELRRYDVSLIHEHRFDDMVKLRTLAYGYITTRDWRRQDYDRVAQPGVAYERIVGDVTRPLGAIYFRDTTRILDRSYQVAGIEPRLELRFDTGGIFHTVDVGARLLGEGAHYEQRRASFPISDAGELELDETRSSLAIAAYLQDRMAFLDETILVTPGVRFEHARYNRKIDRTFVGSEPQDVQIEGDSDVAAVIPGIGMTAGTPDVHGFAGFHVGFAPPRVTSSINPNGIEQPLDPEENLTYELGARFRHRRLVHTEVTGFLSSFANQVVPSSEGDVTELVNGGATRHYGLEASAGVGFGELIGHGVLLDLNGRYTFLQARFVGGDNDGNQLPYAPNHMASAILDVGHDIGIGAQLSYSFVGAQFSDDSNTVAEDITGRSGEIPGYHILDAGLRYRNEATGLSVSVTAKNLPDVPFVISRRPEGVFASGFRQINAGLSWQYDGESP